MEGIKQLFFSDDGAVPPKNENKHSKT